MDHETVCDSVHSCVDLGSGPWTLNLLECAFPRDREGPLAWLWQILCSHIGIAFVMQWTEDRKLKVWFGEILSASFHIRFRHNPYGQKQTLYCSLTLFCTKFFLSIVLFCVGLSQAGFA